MKNVFISKRRFSKVINLATLANVWSFGFSSDKGFQYVLQK